MFTKTNSQQGSAALIVIVVIVLIGVAALAVYHHNDTATPQASTPLTAAADPVPVATVKAFYKAYLGTKPNMAVLQSRYLTSDLATAINNGHYQYAPYLCAQNSVSYSDMQFYYQAPAPQGLERVVATEYWGSEGLTSVDLGLTNGKISDISCPISVTLQ